VVRILHLSDLHLSAPRREDQQHLISSLLRDVQKLHAESAVHLVFFTGDLAYGGKPQEFAFAKDDLLEPLLDGLGLPRSQVFLLPGNHDVDRDRIDRFVEAGAKAQLSDREAVVALQENEDELATLTARLHGWDEFHEQFYETVALERVDPLGYVATLDIEGLQVGIACLNSAWRSSGGASDRGCLLIGERQVTRTLAKLADCFVRVIAVHHPFDWLAPFDADAARPAFESAPSVVLTGHTHVADPTSERSTRGEAIYNRGGCLYQSSEYANAYSLIDIDPTGSKVDLQLRSWWPGRGEFDEATNVIHAGQISFPFPSRRAGMKAIAVSYSQAKQGLEAEIAAITIIADALPDQSEIIASDLIVPPRFLSLPYPEALAAMAQFKDDPPDFTLPPPIDALQAGRVVLVNGDAGSGVTMALYWLLLRAIETDDERLPLLVKFDAHFKASRFERGLRDGARLKDYPLVGNHLPPLVIAIDDVYGQGAGVYDALARYIAGHTGDRYILGCHDSSHEDLYKALSAREVDVERVFLGPFGRTQLRQLVERAIGGVRVDEIVSRITRLMGLNELPRTPFIMTALATVVLEEGDIASINESGLLDSYVALLLGRSRLEGHDAFGLDMRRREHLLAWFAGRLRARKAVRVPRLDAEQDVGSYFRALGWGSSLSPGHVLDDLIRRWVLAEDQEGVGFRHPAFESLFAGKWMAEDAAFADAILADAIENRRAVIHAAGLRRSDRELLRRVGEATAGIVGQLSHQKINETFQLISARPGWSNERREIDDLKRRLEVLPSAPTPSELDEDFDELDTEVEAERAKGDEADSTPPVLKELGSALELASTVVRNSELVDDRALKTAEFQAAIHGWASYAILMAVQEDQDHLMAQRIVDVFEELDVEGEIGDRIHRMSDMLVFVITLMVTHGLLGSTHLEGAITESLDDEEFMRSPLYALITTFLYGELRLRDWPIRLKKLHDEHGSHPVVAEVVQTAALLAYRSDPRITQVDLTRLESLLADTYSRQARGIGPAAPLARAAIRSEVIAELRKGRREAVAGAEGRDPLEALEDVGGELKHGKRNGSAVPPVEPGSS
jgi:predicted MPP superfamily phosphohydrolase